MIVCHCKAVRAEDIKAEVRLGAEDLEQVIERCAAATKCGGCFPAVCDIVAQELARAVTAVTVSV